MSYNTTKCFKCGEVIPEKAYFCPFCGADHRKRQNMLNTEKESSKIEGKVYNLTVDDNPKAEYAAGIRIEKTEFEKERLSENPEHQVEQSHQTGTINSNQNSSNNRKTDLYSLNSGVLRVFGDQKKTCGMDVRISPHSEPVYGVTTLIIEEGVEEIEARAFANYPDLTSVALPNSLKIIGNSAFDNCTSLKEIVIPDSVDVIGFSAFHNCKNLCSVKLPQQMSILHGSAFWEDSSLVSIEIPEGVSVIEEGTFKECTSLETVTIPEGVKTIEEFAFFGSRIKALLLPKTLEVVQELAFGETPLEVLYIGSPKTKFSLICGLGDEVKLSGVGYKIPDKQRIGRILALVAVIVFGIIIDFSILLDLAVVAVIVAAIVRKKNSLPWRLFSGDLWQFLWDKIFTRSLKDRIPVYTEINLD